MQTVTSSQIDTLEDHNKHELFREQLRRNLKNFLLPATIKEHQAEIDLSLERDDLTRANIIRDLMNDAEWMEGRT